MKTVERGHGRLTVSATAGSIGLAVLLGVLAVPAGAALGAAPWSDYANYPSALPAGCADGPAALVGVLFNNGRGDTSSRLLDLTVQAGDVLTMTWERASTNCSDTSISLAAYRTAAAEFVLLEDEELLTWSNAPVSSGSVSITVPRSDAACFLQIDAVLGLPLKVVGPGGSYFSASLRGDDRPNMLLSWRNFGTDCTPPAPQPKPESPVPTIPPGPNPPQPVAPTPVEPVPSTPVTTTPTTPTEPTEPKPKVLPRSELPATGARKANQRALAGTTLLGAGLAFVAAGRRVRVSLPRN